MTEPQTKIYTKRSTLMINNFLGGISWGVGSVIGATLVVSILALILAQTSHIPLIGTIVESVMTEIEKQQSQ